MAHAPATEPQGRHQSRKPQPAAGSVSALEYYDFFIYATAAALIFPQIFFPKGDPAIAIIASLATYGVGYVARPIGAFVLGHIGDTHGRKQVLVWCMFLMGFSTIAVGLLPTYDQIGLWAPALLVLMRLIQGFAVAGEISGASSMILEHAPFGRRGFFASFTLQGVQAGQILAAAVFLPLAHYMPHRAVQQLGLAHSLPAELHRHHRRLDHPPRSGRNPAFTDETAQQERVRSPIVDAFKYHWPDMLRVVCMALMNVIPVVATIFGAAYAVQPAYGIGFAKDIYLWIPVLGNILAVLVIPLVGNLSDKIGRRPPHHHRRAALRAAGLRLPLRHQHPQRAAGDLHVAADVGPGLSGLQRRVPIVLPPSCSRHAPACPPWPFPERGHRHHRHAAGAVHRRGAPRRGQHLAHRGCHRLRRHRDFALAAFTARETFRVPMSQLGDVDAKPVSAQEYDQQRAQALATHRA